MKVHVKLDISDEQRNRLHNLITGKDTKQMVSRAMVCEFVQGMIDAAVEEHEVGTTEEIVNRNVLTPAEEKFIQKLFKQGKDKSYARGQMQVIRRYGLQP